MIIKEVVFEEGMGEDGVSYNMLKMEEGEIKEVRTEFGPTYHQRCKNSNSRVIVPYHAMRRVTIELERGEGGYTPHPLLENSEA